MNTSVNALRIWFECLTYGGMAIVTILFLVLYLQARFEARSIFTISTPINPPNASKVSATRGRVSGFSDEPGKAPDPRAGSSLPVR